MTGEISRTAFGIDPSGKAIVPGREAVGLAGKDDFPRVISFRPPASSICWRSAPALSDDGISLLSPQISLFLQPRNTGGGIA